MDLKLTGKKAFVSGSSRGIGHGIALALLQEGSQVLLNSRSEFNTKDLEEKFPGQVFFVRGDVTQEKELSLIKEKIQEVFRGQLDFIVCNVGTGASVRPGNENYGEWKKSFDMNFFSTTNVVEALKAMLTPKSGSILTVSSICGMEHLGAPLTYSAAKSALNSYVVGMSKVLGQEGIRLNAVIPGNILFEGSVWDRKLKENASQVTDMLKKEVALQTLGTVEDISNTALFLLSEKAKFITGSLIVVDGGQLRSW